MAEAGQYLYAGLAGGGQALTAGMDQLQQLKKAAKVADAEFDLLTPEADALTGETAKHPLGLGKDQWKMMSAQDRIARIGAFRQTTALKSALADQAMQEQQNKLRLAALQEQAAIPGRIQAGAQGWMLENTAGGPVTSEMERQSLLAGLRASGDPRLLLEALRMEQQQEPALGFGAQDVVDLGAIHPSLAGKFQVRQSRGSWQNVDTVPRTGGLPFDERIAVMDRADLQKRRQAITKALGEYLPPNQIPLLTAELQAINTRLEGGGDAPAPKSTRAVGGASTPRSVPKAGEVIDGYRFKGGNPNDPSAWEAAR